MINVIASMLPAINVLAVVIIVQIVRERDTNNAFKRERKRWRGDSE